MVGAARLVSPPAGGRKRVAPAVQVELVPDVTAPRHARDAVSRLNHGTTEELVMQLKLLVSELVTNSVLHAGLGRGDHISLTVAVGTEAVRVEVSDPGPGFAEPPKPDIEATRGRGLLLVERVADRWGVNRGERTRVWFELDR